jgi:hypothetical protein
VPCRKQQQGIALKRERYEELFHVEQRNEAENAEMAECSLSLIEADVFSRRQLERVRMLLNRLADSVDVDIVAHGKKLHERLRLLEKCSELPTFVLRTRRSPS